MPKLKTRLLPLLHFFAAVALIATSTAAVLAAVPTSNSPSPDSILRGRHLLDSAQSPYDVIVDGVNTRTRNYTFSSTDLTLPGTIGPKISLNRVFNANDCREGPFGIGWSMNFAPLLNGITDRHGNRAVFHYTALGNRLSEIDTYNAISDRRHRSLPAYALELTWTFSDPRHPRIISASSYRLSPILTRLQTVTYRYADGLDHSVSSFCTPGGKITTYGYHNWKPPALPGSVNAEQDLLCRISDADGVSTSIIYNDEAGDAYASWMQSVSYRVQAARIIKPVGGAIDFVPAATLEASSGTYIISRHIQDLPVSAEGDAVRTVFYVPGKSGIWVVSGWHSKGEERLYDTASGCLKETDYCAGFNWSHRVPSQLLALPRNDMDYDDRYRFWTLVDMVHSVFWQDIFSPGVPGTQLLDGGVVYLRKTYTYDSAGRLTATTATGFPFTADQGLPTRGSKLVSYSRYTGYWGADKYGQKKMVIDPDGRRTYYDYFDRSAKPELRGNLRAVYVGGVPVRVVSLFDAEGQPASIRSCIDISQLRFKTDRFEGLDTVSGHHSLVLEAADGSKRRSVLVFDALGRVIRQSQTISGKKKPTRIDVLTAYLHRGNDSLASDGEMAERRIVSPRGSLNEFSRCEYTRGGRLLCLWNRSAAELLACRTLLYERRGGSMTGRVSSTKAYENGVLRCAMVYGYGGIGGEDLKSKTLTIIEGHSAAPETWRWSYGNYSCSPDLDMKRFPARIVQYGPGTANPDVQAVDYVYDSCFGTLGLVRFAVQDANPQELADRILQDQTPKQFEFEWYEHDSFGRVFDIRLYRGLYGQSRFPGGYAYSLLGRIEYFRLKPDSGNLSGFDPHTFTMKTAPYDLSGNVRYRRAEIASVAGSQIRLAGRAYSTGTAIPWSPADSTEVPIDVSWAGAGKSGGHCEETILLGGRPLMRREYDRNARLGRSQVAMLGVRGVEGVTDCDGSTRVGTRWRVDDGRGGVVGWMSGDGKMVGSREASGLF